MRRSVVLSIFGLALVGCGGLEKKVIGTYQLQFVTKFENGMTASGDLGATLTIKKDGTAISTSGRQTEILDWSVSGGQIILTTRDGKSKVAYDVSYDGQTFTVNQDAGMKFVRLEK